MADQRGNDLIKIKFSKRDGGPCPFHEQCTTADLPRRTLTLRPEDQYKALQAAREREHTEEYAAEYARRAGIEGTLSQGVRAFGLRRARYLEKRGRIFSIC